MNLEDKKQDFENIVEHAEVDMGSVRTNRATPALVENIKVDVYGSKMPINQLANISIPEPRQLIVEAWDKNNLKEIEKAIQGEEMGLSVTNEGGQLRLSMPAMTDETRQKILKMLQEKVENSKVSLRSVRDKVKEEINKAEKEKEISEDEKYSLLEKLDEMTREYAKKIDELGEKKENEIKL